MGALYAYQCQYCGNTRELWRPIRDRDTGPCCMNDDHDCANTPMRRVVTAPAIRGATVSKP